jgi:hypothetical protein
MFDSVALYPSALRPESAAKPAQRKGFAAMFKAVLESLVKANSNRFDETETAFYRFPPV